MARICILLTTPPTPDPEPAELALALATFDHEVQVICIGPGLGWLLDEQSSRKDGGKSPDKLLRAFPMYDIEHVGYRAQDLLPIAATASRSVWPNP